MVPAMARQEHQLDAILAFESADQVGRRGGPKRGLQGFPLISAGPSVPVEAASTDHSDSYHLAHLPPGARE